MTDLLFQSSNAKLAAKVLFVWEAKAFENVSLSRTSTTVSQNSLSQQLKERGLGKMGVYGKKEALKFGQLKNIWPNAAANMLDTPAHIYNDDDDVIEPLYSTSISQVAPPPVTSVSAMRCVFDRSSAKGPHLWYSLDPSGNDETLQFESRFESGNLSSVSQRAAYVYELHLDPDRGAEKRYAQWFYFSVTNMRRGTTYAFHINGFGKNESLFGDKGGARPLFYSTGAAKRKGVGWRRIGSNVQYHIRQGGGKTSTLSFTFQLNDVRPGDTCYFAACYPYRYSDLQQHLETISKDRARAKRMRRRLLCETLAGNRCDLLIITSFNGTPLRSLKRKSIVVTARVHPGETNASWVMKGLIDFLTGPSLDAKVLRDNFVFYVVPMLNPDGVVVGNTRCSLAGVDLNRVYSDPDPKQHPTIFHLKNLIETLSMEENVFMFCDFHGHSTKHNTFMYGCDERQSRTMTATNGTDIEDGDRFPEEPDNEEEEEEEEEETLRLPVANAEQKKKTKKGKTKKKRRRRRKKRKPLVPREVQVPDTLKFPQLMTQACKVFSLSDCNFSIQRYKESAGRVCVYRESWGQTLSYTLETSLGGVDVGPLRGYHLNRSHFQGIGYAFGDALLDYVLNENENGPTKDEQLSYINFKRV